MSGRAKQLHMLKHNPHTTGSCLPSGILWPKVMTGEMRARTWMENLQVSRCDWTAMPLSCSKQSQWGCGSFIPPSAGGVTVVPSCSREEPSIICQGTPFCMTHQRTNRRQCPSECIDHKIPMYLLRSTGFEFLRRKNLSCAVWMFGNPTFHSRQKYSVILLFSREVPRLVLNGEPIFFERWVS